MCNSKQLKKWVEYINVKTSKTAKKPNRRQNQAPDLVQRDGEAHFSTGRGADRLVDLAEMKARASIYSCSAKCFFFF